ncbi:MAG TPA: hypothetical protein VGS13_10620 [Stellaceae bacterium]|nr:hypothetical protein [Stellaceae bacterium]
MLSAWTGGPVSTTRRRICLGLLGALSAVLAVRAVGVFGDFAASIHFPFELEYGEGIVWQQAALIPGRHMYGTAQDLPFIVFHYPPLYYLLARAALSVEPNFLAAGRLVSALGAVLTALSVAALVRISARGGGRPIERAEWAIAIAAGLLTLRLYTVHDWSLLMRVDTAAIALSMLGLLVGAWANGRFLGTTVALLFCLASVYTKQTELPAGVAVFLIAVTRNPRGALGAAAIAGLAGLAALGVMQWLTDGGFLLNIVGYNINRYSLRHAWLLFLSEQRANFPFMALMPIAAGAVLLAPVEQRPGERWRPAIARFVAGLGDADRATAARAIVLVHFTLASVMLLTAGKSGANSNFFLDWDCVGCVLIGVMLCDLIGAEWRASVAATGPILALMLLGVLILPQRDIEDGVLEAQQGPMTALLGRIAAATKPVASEEMALLMRAGKPLVFEPAIVTELATLGRWDERPLVGMIRSGGFAFMITTDDTVGGSERRTPAVDAAMREAYPRVEQPTPYLWLHLPGP